MNYERERRAAHRGGEVGFGGILNSPFSQLHSYALLKIKIYYWHQWFNKEALPSMEPSHSTKGSLQWKKVL